MNAPTYKIPSSPYQLMQRHAEKISRVPQLNHSLFAKSDSGDDEDEEDWRAFRAKLVMSEGPSSESSSSPQQSVDNTGDNAMVVDDSDLDGMLLIQLLSMMRNVTNHNDHVDLEKRGYNW